MTISYYKKRSKHKIEIDEDKISVIEVTLPNGKSFDISLEKNGEVSIIGSDSLNIKTNDENFLSFKIK